MSEGPQPLSSPAVSLEPFVAEKREPRYSLGVEWLHLDFDHFSDSGDEVILRFQRLGFQLVYPLGAIFWKTPLRGRIAVGGERSSLLFQNRDKRMGQVVEVNAESVPTFFIGKSVELLVMNPPEQVSFFDSQRVDITAFMDGAWSLFPRRFDDYRVDVQSDNNRLLEYVDINALARQNIQRVLYNLFSLDFGVDMRYRWFPYFQPYLRAGYSYYDASVIVRYSPNGRILMKASNIRHEELLTGVFDFDQDFFNVAMGARLLANPWYRIDVGGMWRPNDRGFLGEYLGTGDTGVRMLRAVLTLFMER